MGGEDEVGRRVRAHTDAHASANAHVAPPGATASIASPGGLRRAHLAFPSVDPRRSPRPPPPSGEISGTRRAREPDPGTVAGWSSWSNADASASSSARQSRSIVAAIDVDVEETPASAFALDARRGAFTSPAVVVPALGDPGFAAREGFPAAAVGHRPRGGSEPAKRAPPRPDAGAGTVAGVDRAADPVDRTRMKIGASSFGFDRRGVERGVHASVPRERSSRLWR